MTREILAAVGLAMVFLGLAGWAFVSRFERVEVEVRSGFSPVAQRNPLLALERYLRRTGEQVRTRSGRIDWGEVLESGGVVFLDDPVVLRRRTVRSRVMGWMARGGRLVTVLTPRAAGQGELVANPFFSQWPIRLERRVREEADPVDLPLTTVPAAGGGRPLAVRFPPDYALVDDSGLAVPLADGPFGLQGLQIRYGKGRLTVLSDATFMRNEAVGDFDHAFFAQQLLQGAGGRVWLLYRIRPAGLFELLWQRAPLMVMAMAALIIMGLWSLYNRFGVPPPVRPPGHAGVLAQLRARGHFHWRLNRAQGLVSAARRWRGDVGPHWPDGVMAGGLEERAARLGIPLPRLRQALCNPVRDEVSLIETAELLRRLRNHDE